MLQFARQIGSFRQGKMGNIDKKHNNIETTLPSSRINNAHFLRLLDFLTNRLGIL